MTSTELRAPGAPTDSEQLREVLVTGRTDTADGVVTLVLDDPEGGALPSWTAGAHLDVLFPGGERQYSLCGTTPGQWSVSVLRAPDSRGGSQWVHDQVRVGDRLQVRGPRNRFPLVPASRYLFLAGGIGITPIIAMIRELEAAGTTDWTLAYGGRSRASMAFLHELEAHGERVQVLPQETHGLLDLGAVLGAPAIGTAVYCCGPEPMLVAVERACRSWPPGALHVERFAPVEVDASGDRPFEVVAVRSGITATVEVGDTILQVLEDQGVAVPTSCGEGVCGTCETAVLEGEVDHRDAVLTDAERATNTLMMVCCSRARGDRLVLDV